ncbi:MAG: hypothetical protein HFF39_08245 [Lawsonibacter sp.]|nr:hypothetical protein [Lawsonibacter sp.]
MWTSERSRKRPVEEAAADTGAVTLGESPAGVYLEGERRGAQVYSPGGYRWRPAQGDQVLVLKAGGERESPCVIGCRQEDGLGPGEVEIACQANRASIRLLPVGEIELNGGVVVNGKPLEELIAEIAQRYAGG